MDMVSEGSRTKEVIWDMSESEASADSVIERMNKTFLCIVSSMDAVSVMNLANEVGVVTVSSMDAVSERFLVKIV